MNRQSKPGGEQPHESRCADLAGMLDDLVDWAMQLPLDWFHELAHDALDDCSTRAES
jgi:hypothetical protein